MSEAGEMEMHNMDRSSIEQKPDQDPAAEEWPDQMDAEVHDSRHGVHTGVTFYKVRVRNPQGEEWEVQRRYREFEELKQRLAEEKVKITNFPGKKLWGRQLNRTLYPAALSGAVVPVRRLPR